MNKSSIDKWFCAFTDSYRKNGTLPSMLEIKFGHSRRVAANALAIAESEGLTDGDEILTAYMVGLLHDVGRFEQYIRYETFLDAASIDHGDFGAELLEEKFDWSSVPGKIREAVITGVKYHNKKDVPEALPSYVLPWVKLIRDADKIDIFRTIQQRIDNGTIFDMMPRHEKVTGLNPVLVEEISSTMKGSWKNARSLQDFRLVQMTWGTDLNFSYSVDLLVREGIFDRISDDLRNYHINELLSTLNSEILSKIKK